MSSWIDEAHDDMLEMAQLKSDFDADKFTRAKEGPFIAHQFHFVMRRIQMCIAKLGRIQWLRRLPFQQIMRSLGAQPLG